MLKLIRAALIAPAIALAACETAPQRPACPTGQVCLELGNSSEPQSLDPHKANLVDEAAIIGDLMMGLTTEAPDASTLPGAAESWSVSPDGLTWTFRLREHQWSDGRPVTADDFVFGIGRTLDPKTGAIYAYLLYVIKNGQPVNEGKLPISALGLKAPDPRTLVIELEHPAPYLPEAAKHQSFFPAPRHVVERYGDDWVQPGRYVSNGAYRLTGWRLGDRITVEKNPRFWDAANVCVDRINYYPTPDVVTAERQVARGELDMNSSFQSNRYGRIKTAMPGYPRTGLSLSTAYLSFNTRDVTAFKDVRVRRALSMAIDREFITRGLLRAGQIPAYAFVPPVTANYAPASRSDGPRLRWSGLPFPQRQAEARRLLAEAGFGPERPLKITITSANSTTTLMLMEVIQADWRAVGVEVTLQQNETGVAFAAYRQRNFEVGSMSWVGDFNDPLTFLGLMKSDTGAQNYGDYKSPAYDALLAAADQEPDLNRRADLLAKAEQIMLDDEAMIPMYYAVNRDLVNPRITGWAENPPKVHRARWFCVRPTQDPAPK